MEDQPKYNNAVSNLQAYLNCASIVMFLTSVAVLGAAYSPLQLIPQEILTAVGGRSGYMMILPLGCALVISGFQITMMWSENSLPRASEMLLFVLMHLVTFLVAYIGVAALLPVIPSSIVPGVLIVAAIWASLVVFMRTRDKHLNPDA